MASSAPPSPSTLVLVALSGGVDSAVAALLLKRAGHRLAGLFMANWDEEDSYCTQAQDFQDARRVCEVLDIPLHRASFAAGYRERVFEHFLAEYRAGRTPNPDVLCNREIKFGLALKHAARLGAASVATGHYARLEHGAAGPRLLKALDPVKDQSYFLHGVERTALERVLMPLGELRKQEVRRLAHAAGLPVYDKPDSTGICFIGERPFREFLGRYLPMQPGPILTAGGQVIGQHGGLAFYTLGQRSGLGVGGRAGAAAAPWYVADKDPSRNALIVVQDPSDPLLLTSVFEVEAAHWLVPPAGADFPCSVKTRYRQADLRCRVQILEQERLRVVLDVPARAVTPGQYAVFYAAELCLGGGVIAHREPLARGHPTRGNEHRTTGEEHPTPGEQHCTRGDEHPTTGDEHLTRGDERATGGASIAYNFRFEQEES